MKTRLTTMIGAGLLSAALMLAQAPAQPAPAAGQSAHRHGGKLRRLIASLNLSPDQAAQAKAIFRDAHAGAQPIAVQMRDARAALANAVRANAPATEIDRLSNNAGALRSQLTAMRAKSMAKFYTILTPEQKDKLDSERGRLFKG